MTALVAAVLPTRTTRRAVSVLLGVLAVLATALLLPDLVATVQSEGFLAVLSSGGRFSVDGLKWVR